MMAEKITQRRLPFWRTVIDAYVVTFRNINYLGRISWMWLLVMIPVSLAFHSLMFGLGWHVATDSLRSLTYTTLSFLLFLPLLASIAVAWHRRLLLGEVWPHWIYIRLDRSVFGYFVLTVIITIVIWTPLLALIAEDIDRAEEAG